MGFWEDGGRDCVKTHLRENLESIAMEEEAAPAHTGGDPESSELPAEHEGEGNIGQDHPEVLVAKKLRPHTWDWQKENEKFLAAKGLPKVRRPLWPVYREMLINGNSYQVVKVAEWMHTHLGRTLEDFDRHRVSCREDSARFWRDFKRSVRQEAIACRRYSLVCASPPSPLRIVYDVSSNDEPCSSSCSLGSGDCFGGEDVFYL
uniref:Uncharacterized protein n=1 Tax=Oryza meridionalis TaxID=40149 RepID=A0A0E0EWZ7_9ORYZ